MQRRLILASAVLGLLGFLAGVLAHFDWRPSALCDFGKANLEASAPYRASAQAYFRPGFVLTEGSGYDGQYDFFIACDPLALKTEGGYRDAYRWQRILHPALAWALALGNPGRIPAAMAAVTLGGILLGTWALLRLLELPSWWVLAYAFGVAHLYGLQLGVGGPALSLGLCVAALLAWQRGKLLACWLLLAAALLARESAVLVIAPLALWAFLSGRRRDALLVAASIFPFLLWEAYLRWRLGTWGLGTSGGHLTWPLAGMLRRATLLEGSGVDFHSPRGLANNAVLLGFLAYGVLVAVDALATFLRNRRDLFAFLYAGNAAFFCCLTATQFVDLNGASRPFLTVLPFLVLSKAAAGGWYNRLVLGGGLLFSAAVFIKVIAASPPYGLWSG